MRDKNNLCDTCKIKLKIENGKCCLCYNKSINKEFNDNSFNEFNNLNNIDLDLLER